MFGLVEDNHDLDFPDPMPVVGKIQLDIVKDLLLIHVDEFSFGSIHILTISGESLIIQR